MKRKLGSKLSDALKSIDAPARTAWRTRPEILLHGNIPKPLHGMAPRVVLGASWWNKERRAAYASTDHHCLACGVSQHLAQFRKWLEGHEIYVTDYVKGTMTYVETVPLCHCCHAYVHSGRLQALLESGKIHHAKYAAIVQHGDRVLAQAGIKREPPYNGPTAEWGKWRLIIGRKRYKGLFKNVEEWVAYHQLKNESSL